MWPGRRTFVVLLDLLADIHVPLRDLALLGLAAVANVRALNDKLVVVLGGVGFAKAFMEVLGRFPDRVTGVPDGVHEFFAIALALLLEGLLVLLRERGSLDLFADAPRESDASLAHLLGGLCEPFQQVFNVTGGHRVNRVQGG